MQWEIYRPVKHVDRAAAANCAVLEEMRDLIRSRRMDDSTIVQAWAGHREDAELNERTAICEWLLNQNFAHASQRRAIAQLAEAIEHGQHYTWDMEAL